MCNCRVWIEPNVHFDQRNSSTVLAVDGNNCFYGKCKYCHGESTGVCAEGTRLEGSIVMWLPERLQLRLWKHPWSRTYREAVTAR